MVYHLRTAVYDDSGGANTVIVAPVPNTKTKPTRQGGKRKRSNYVRYVYKADDTSRMTQWFEKFGDKQHY